MSQLSNHFGGDENGASNEQLRRKQWFIKSRQEAQRQEMLEGRFESNLTAFSTATAYATEIQLEEFSAKLDIYEEATVKALMLNQVRLDEVNAEIEDMLANAFIMDDGRRVFKSEDGSLVIDEFGEVVTREEIDPDLIPDGGSTPQQFLNALEIRNTELEVRSDLHDYQNKLDDARDQVSNGEITEEELIDLDADLFDAMPSSVKGQISGFDTIDNAPDAKAIFSVNATPSTNTAGTSSAQVSVYDPMS